MIPANLETVSPNIGLFKCSDHCFVSIGVLCYLCILNCSISIWF